MPTKSETLLAAAKMLNPRQIRQAAVQQQAKANRKPPRPSLVGKPPFGVSNAYALPSPTNVLKPSQNLPGPDALHRPEV